RDRLAALFELVRYPDLTPARLLDRQFHHRRLNRRIHPVGQDRLRAADLLQRQLAAFVVELLEPVKAVPAITHHLAGLAHIAELLGQLQQSDLGPDHLLCLRHRGSSIRVKLGRVPHLDFPHRSPATVRLSPYLYNFPKGTDLSMHSADDIAAVAAALNARPRKTLAWNTPAEALDQL